MMDTLVQIVFGWPAIVTSLAASALGVASNRPWLSVVGATLFVPFSYYLSGAPGVRWLALALPLFQVASAFAVHKTRTQLAWLLLAPAFLVSAWVAILVLSQ